MIKKIKKMRVKVTDLITKTPHLRDDDRKLIATVWLQEIGRENILNMSAMEFLMAMSKGEVSDSEAICRARRKVQEETPELRGESYVERQKRCDDIIKNIQSC